VSPNEKFLAYLNNDDPLEPVLVFHNLETGVESRILIRDGSVSSDVLIFSSNIVWSPDSQSLIYVLESNRCGPPNLEKHSIIEVDLNSLEHKTLLAASDLCFVPLKWTSNNRISLQDKNGKSWSLDSQTGQLTELK
jgi:hypothetical protein